MAQEGWFPLLCVGLRSQWEDVHLQDLQDSYGQEWVRIDFKSYLWVLFKLWTQKCLVFVSWVNVIVYFISPSPCLLISWQTFSQRLYQEYTCYTVFFVSIEICQISDVLIRKTRRLSVFQQGFFRSVKTHQKHESLCIMIFFFFGQLKLLLINDTPFCLSLMIVNKEPRVFELLIGQMK